MPRQVCEKLKGHEIPTRFLRYSVCLGGQNNRNYDSLEPESDFFTSSLGYVDGMGLYEYCQGWPFDLRDPQGQYGISDWWADLNDGIAEVNAPTTVVGSVVSTTGSFVGGVAVAAVTVTVVAAASPVVATVGAVGLTVYGGYQVGESIYETVTGTEATLNGDGKQLDNVEYAASVTNAALGVVTMGLATESAISARVRGRVVRPSASGSLGGSKPCQGNQTGGNFQVSLLDAKARTHILDGEPHGPGGGHRAGIGRPGKSEFPSSWSDAQIEHVVSDIATDPTVNWSILQPNGNVVATKTINGIDVKVVYNPKMGRIVSPYPTNFPKNP